MNEAPDQGIPFWFQPVRSSEIIKWRRILPHFEQEGGTYFVTFRMADSVSRETQKNWTQARDLFMRLHPRPWDSKIQEEFRETISNRMEDLLDAGYGSCRLKDPVARGIVEDALLHFSGSRYHLDSFVIMPNHVHIIVCPISPFPLSKLIHSWKSYTAHQICDYFTLKSPFWLEEKCDHLVRNSFYLCRYRDYILENPKKAGLKAGHYTLCKQARGL